MHILYVWYVYSCFYYLEGVYRVHYDSGSSAAGRHLLLLTCDCIRLQVDLLNVRYREDLIQLQRRMPFYKIALK
jgi:Na+-translocating ferredoxin:NAD+ oxidoreductase RnfA subunit